MLPADVLPTIAEIAVTLAGFTAVLFAIQSYSAGGDVAGQSDRILAVLTIPAVTLVCALLPFALAGLSESDAIIWGVPLFVYALGGGSSLARTVVRIARGSARLTWPAVSYTVIAVATLLALLSLASGLGLLLPYSPGVLVVGLIWNLMAAAFSLITAVRAAMNPTGA